MKKTTLLLNTLFLISIIIVFTGCPSEDIIKDIDHNQYKTVKIGDQIWMAENLRVTHYSDGTEIEYIADPNKWKNSNSGAYCDFENNSVNAKTYGHLYNWYAVNNNRKIAPKGWHVANKSDWDTLIKYIEGLTNAGIMLKESGTAHWLASDCCLGTNKTGFTALGASYRGTDGGWGQVPQSSIRAQTGWWVISDSCFPGALYFALSYDMPYGFFDCVHNDPEYKKNGRSVRFVKDK